MNWQTIVHETTTLLQDLIRFDTTNLPGNETPCIEHIARVLNRDGVESQVFESAPGRGNLVARLQGDGSLPPLLLMGHVDVVTAEADKWHRAPFSGDLVDGIVWGRGATDMKQMVAMELMVFLLAKRNSIPLKRDLIFMANADEEVGGRMGAGWMAAHHPDLIRAEYAINEGGPTSIVLDDKVFYVCSTAEKGSARFTIRTRGKPGHASQPHQDHSILYLARALTKLIETPLPLRVCKSARGHIEAMARGVDGATRANLLGLLDERTNAQSLAALPLPETQKRRLNAALHNTAVPTILKAGSKINVIPGEAECQVDCRVLPSTTPESLEQELRAVLGNDIELEFTPFSPALESDPDSPLFETIRRVVEEHEPGATLVPGLITGGTDAKSLTTLGTKVLGFVPMRYEGPDMTGLAHNHNERVSVANLEFGARVLWDVVARFCASGSW
ncbi:MAG: M20/M25/M40 family metallo-hydrolase [Chloroflexi bacterium]|nr:M20/M25/M40 family metallo-hydrolase [Chloroflexota bacterium]